MRKQIEKAIEDGIRAIQFLQREESLEFLEKSAERIVECFSQGGKLLIAGNGGSLCDAMHFAEEMTGLFRKKRSPLPAIALSCPGHISCVANDIGYEAVFARMIESLGKPEDIFIALSTSGNSLNLIEAMAKARQIGMRTISFLGKTGGKLRNTSDLELLVEGFTYSDRIQEAHMTAIHIIIEMVETHLFALSNVF